jgi:hypothetical protein
VATARHNFFGGGVILSEWPPLICPFEVKIALIPNFTVYLFRGTLTSTLAPGKVAPMKTSKDIIKQVQVKVLESVRGTVFLDLNDHFQEQLLHDEDDHGNQLIKKFSNLFLRTVLHHHGHLYTERYVKDNCASKRHQLTKNILWMGD